MCTMSASPSLGFAALALMASVALAPGAVDAAPEASGAKPAADAATGFKKITWASLVPTGWNPMAGIELQNYSKYGDGDPRATEALKKLQDAWSNAPTNRSLEDAAVRINGYIIPLDAEAGKVREFLLVPYFGACIHTPPPPPNQIIHVMADTPVAGLKMMDAVWVNGTVKAIRTDTGFGSAGYRINAVAVTPYTSAR
jgi:hypothetical protein